MVEGWRGFRSGVTVEGGRLGEGGGRFYMPNSYLTVQYYAKHHTCVEQYGRVR